MDRQSLIAEIHRKKSFLCVGLDTDLNRIPKHLLEFDDPVFEFNKAIIETTQTYAVAYKLNLAFYEMLGPKGWESLQKTIDYLPPNVLSIADAKRGDIGNTSDYYARTFFDTYKFDALTLAPYMGSDSIQPFLRKDKWAIVLGLTSNKGAENFQYQPLQNGSLLYEEVIRETAKWGTHKNMMFVVGATQAKALKSVRELIPKHFLLVPGVGAQGGSLKEVCQYGMNSDVGLLVNSSRGIIYADSGASFKERAGEAAQSIQQEMATFL